MSATRGGIIFGIGINDADYAITPGSKNRKRCKYFSTWSGMISRCYSEKTQSRNPTYIGCTVCAEWLRFSTFKAWMEQQDWEGRELDKDILFPGNKVYSPDTCVFVTRAINSFMGYGVRSGRSLPQGVSFHKIHKKYISSCGENGKLKFLGYYETAEEAHEVWLAYKLKLAYNLAEQEPDIRVANALVDRYINYKEYFKSE